MNRETGPASPKGRRVRLAGWLAIPDPLVVEAVARAGFDWLGLDLQHGAWDLGTAFRGIQLADALDTPVLVRLPDEQLSLIPRVLDHGASGIVLAMASEPEVVAAAIERARYQPEGKRSYGGQRYGMRREPSDPTDVRPGIYAMVETRRGVEAVGEIAAVRGLAGLHVGPTDLGLALGVGRDLAAPVFADAVASIVAAGHANGLPVTMHAVAPGQAAMWVDMGFDELVLTSDIEVLRGALAGLIDGAEKAIAGENAAKASTLSAYGAPL